MTVYSNDFGLLSPTYLQTSSSALVKTGCGRLRGVFCSSSAGGTLKLWDNTSGATTVLVNVFDLTAATYYDFGDVTFGTGLYATIANTAEITVFYF